MICASCPEGWEEEVSSICRQHKIARAFGMQTAAVGLVEERGATRARLVCVDGSLHAQEQLIAQHQLLLAIRATLGKPSFPIRVEWLPLNDFRQEFGKGCEPAQTATGVVSTMEAENVPCSAVHKPKGQQGIVVNR